jgi:pilus assembly protein Flp/PilA
MTNLFKRFIKDESGATAIEYGLLAALISVVLIAAAGTVGNSLQNTFNAISSALDTANQGAN